MKRHARMTRREAPSEHQLRENLAKRLYIPEGGRPGSRTKRYNRHGVPKPKAQAISAARVKGAKGKGKGAKAAKGAA